jgi:hypothetical protein
MTKLYKIEANCETGVVTETELTPEEVAAHEAISAAMLAAEQEREAAFAARETLKESARAKLVAGEPLTEEEAATIVL